MVIYKGNELTIIVFLGLALLFQYKVEGRDHRGLAQVVSPIAGGPGPAVFDVTKFGAKGDGQPDISEDDEDLNALAFIQAWNAACKNNGPSKVLIPPGKYVVSQVLFVGPCPNSRPEVELQGTLIANTDLSLYPSSEWILFQKVDGVMLTGNGTFDGQGQANWASNDCKKNKNCAKLPTSIKFHRANHSIIEGITSVNSMFFHIFVTVSQNVTIRNVNLTAPDTSPNTDGIHTSLADMVNITDSVIGTGDDCVSIGQGSSNIFVSGIKCGPGHGISVGSLGKEDTELGVSGVHVKNCTFSQTKNGARIKTWPGEVATEASNITYEDLVMDIVKNPIVIDQQYGSKKKKSVVPSSVKISNVEFKNIRGTSASNAVVYLACSKSKPCEGIKVADVNLKPIVLKGLPKAEAACDNAKVTFEGINEGISICGPLPKIA